MSRLWPGAHRAGWFCGALAALSASAHAEAQGAAQTRLVGASGLRDGVYRAALVIDLPKGAITYWRNPGDAGVAPVFDFSGSHNLKQAEAFLPAPERIKEADGEALGYRERALFFVRAQPEQTSAPVRLALRLDYAVCEKLCVPARADLTLELSPDAKSAEDALVAQAEGAIPARVDAQTAVEVSPVKGSAPAQWRIVPRGAAEDLFVEPPEGFFAETRRANDAFTLTLLERPRAAPAQAPFRFTMKRAAGAVAFTVSLDLGGQKP